MRCAGHCFTSWEAFEAHLARWEREVANVRIHGTTGEAPIARFEREEAHRLKPLGGRPAFGSLRELARVVGNDCAIEIDTNGYSVPWRLIGERVAVTVAAGQVRIRHGAHEVAATGLSKGAASASWIALISMVSRAAPAQSAHRRSKRRPSFTPRRRCCCGRWQNTKPSPEGPSQVRLCSR